MKQESYLLLFLFQTVNHRDTKTCHFVYFILLLRNFYYHWLDIKHETICDRYWGLIYRHNNWSSGKSKYIIFIFTHGTVGWLILLPPGLCWYIMGYESEPLPSYHELRNYYYSIKLSCTPSFSTLWVPLPHPGPTIAPTGLYLASNTPPCTAHIWGGRPPFPIWLHSASWCTPLWGGAQ